MENILVCLVEALKQIILFDAIVNPEKLSKEEQSYIKYIVFIYFFIKDCCLIQLCCDMECNDTI